MSDLPPLRQQVRDEWIDYNGHVSEAYYVLVFGYATDAVLDRLGVDADYRERTGCSLYTVDARVRYLREVAAGSEMVVTSEVTEIGTKKVRIWHEMTVAGELVSTEDVLTVHVDTQAGKATPLPEQLAVTTD